MVDDFAVKTGFAIAAPVKKLYQQHGCLKKLGRRSLFQTFAQLLQYLALWKDLRW
jgi:hypothetical protein